MLRLHLWLQLLLGLHLLVEVAIDVDAEFAVHPIRCVFPPARIGYGEKTRTRSEVRKLKKALLRLEDIGPGGYYDTEESLWKLRVVADFLASERVPFHVAMIPRFVDPAKGYDKAVDDPQDPYVQKFRQTMKALQSCGASLGMHGYRHQYQKLPSGEGFEFYYADCREDCVPDDPQAASFEKDAFERSYVSARMSEGFATIRRAGLQVDWFETPHYAAEGVQRWEIEAWAGMLFENDPRVPDTRKVSVQDIDTPLYRGVVYVPTPLYYVDGSKPEAEVERIIKEIKGLSEGELAAFFYHPVLEFPFIRQEHVDGQTRVVYDDRSYLKRLIRTFKQQQFQFVPLASLVPFVPSARITDFFPGEDFVFLIGDVDGDRYAELLIWEKSTGRFWTAKGNLDVFPSRQCEPWEMKLVLEDRVHGEEWQPFVADFNGDGKADVAMWHRERGEWRFACSDGVRLQPQAMVWQGVAAKERCTPLVGDFDGDGCAEVRMWDAFDRQCYRLHEGEWQSCLQGGSLAGEWTALVGDFNGDGRDDVVFWGHHSGNWVVAYSDGQMLTMETAQGGPPLLTGWAQGKQWQVFIGDFDGDGKDDLLAVDVQNGDWQVALRSRAGDRFQAIHETLQPWATGAFTQPLVGVFTHDGRASIAARNGELRGGVLDFAVSMLGRR